MLFTLDGNSEIGAHVLSKMGNLICSRHLFSSTAVTYLIFFQNSSLFIFIFKNIEENIKKITFEIKLRSWTP